MFRILEKKLKKKIIDYRGKVLKQQILSENVFYFLFIFKSNKKTSFKRRKKS